MPSEQRTLGRRLSTLIYLLGEALPLPDATHVFAKYLGLVERQRREGLTSHLSLQAKPVKPFKQLRKQTGR